MLEAKDVVPLLSAIVALVSAFSIAFFALINYRRERLNQKIQYANLKQQYFAALRAWSEQLSDILSEAIHFAELDPSKCPPGAFFERRNKLRVTISSMIDKGRWFFSNLHTEEIGQHKEKAFRGYRQEVLNSLVTAYDSVTTLNYVDGKDRDARRKELVEAKKKFVSEIQEALDPTKRDEEFQHITRAVVGGNG
jgi:hypothetical protein